MASTIQLQRTINLAQQFLRLAPLTFTENTADDPAFSNADWVKQFILSPALGGWRWNRSNTTPTAPSFTTIPGQSDYVVNIPNFGWLEKAVAYEPQNGYAPHELQVELIKGQDTNVNQLARIASQYDDGNGNITFRVFPAPDIAYNVALEWQGAATLFTSVTQTWAPIPDYLSYVVNEGFAARAYEYSNDPRFTSSMQLFIQLCADAAEGLDATQKNIFLSDKLNSLRETARVQAGKA